jgi:hypothetical protein
MRQRLFRLLLWIAVLMWTTWIGGTLYQMVVIVPIWSASVPQNLNVLFHDLHPNLSDTARHFFGPSWVLPRYLPPLLALLVGWPFVSHRRWLLITALSTVIIVASTFLYVYPINAVLFFGPARESQSPEELRALAEHWILVDRLRYAVGIGGFLALLRAFSLPVVSKAD